MPSSGIARHEARDDKAAEWQRRSARYLKVELKKRAWTYKILSELLTKYGIPESPQSVASKLSRGTLGVAFFLSCLVVMKIPNVRVKDM